MNTQSKLPTEKSNPVLFVLGVIFFVVFIILPMTYGSLWGDTTRKDTPPCTMTTKQVQTVVKIDGGVDSVETEMVTGCEYPDGSFLQTPN